MKNSKRKRDRRRRFLMKLAIGYIVAVTIGTVLGVGLVELFELASNHLAAEVQMTVVAVTILLLALAFSQLETKRYREQLEELKKQVDRNHTMLLDIVQRTRGGE